MFPLSDDASGSDRNAERSKAGVDPVRAAVAVVVRPRSGGGFWLLVGHRFPDAHLPDLWEFPGGKIEPGETPEDCARREVLEETGVRVRVIAPLLSRSYAYADRTVALDFLLCSPVSGIPQAIGCRALRWVKPENLGVYPFPDANEPVLQALREAGFVDDEPAAP